ncbi:hypothetical protein TTHERM_00298300 (macronuclear) [Tetrahymena thermophila SB210]|uniref:UvrD-like helicase ATP-binding domain-containing protein n=1 Tax=Tetrahymena thermophila (strain SB210) TaxID=312017 RepID=I7LX97_TETTS|nr:hypothetical protein TTHERM_00298300 [Tetrahymena thermophila SB210]EAS04219.2 hypothetical protein TTHERM_00298300 [Tetrahymena thermophila SB210]|eukprot:XP_001024464.2 hypothetical protein TTHERM_00298300 [Tetrahymena thermophila SB210]
MIEQSQTLQQQHYQRYDYQLDNYISTQRQLLKKSEEEYIIQYLRDHKSWVDQKLQYGDQNQENPYKFIRSLWNWSVSDQFLNDFSKLNKSQMYNKLYYMEKILSGNFNGFEKLEIEDCEFENSQTKVGIQYLDIFYPNIVVVIGLQQIPMIRDSHVIKFKFEWYIMFQSIFDQQFQKTPNTDFSNILEDPLKQNYITDLSNFINPLDMIRTSKQYQNRKERLANVDRYLPQQIPDYYLTYQESMQYFNFGYGWIKKQYHKRNIQFNNKKRIQQMNQAYLYKMLQNEDISEQMKKIIDICKIETPLTQQQTQVISNHSNLIVMGRSGTGKTLCALYHLLALEVLYKLHFDKNKNSQMNLIDSLSEKKIGLQSVFITASPILTRKIQKYYQKHKNYLQKAIINISNKQNSNDSQIYDQSISFLIDSLISDFTVLQEESKIQIEDQYDDFDVLEIDDNIFIEPSEQEISAQLKSQSRIKFSQGHPSFYTVRSYLMSLECCLERHFFERDKQGNIIQYSSQNSLGKFQHQRFQLNQIYQHLDQIQDQQKEDFEINEQIFYKNNKLSNYDAFMRDQFLENNMHKQNQENDFIQDQKSRKFEIDYNYFANYFWPFVSIKFKSSSLISCSSLWTEIYSVIKGSANCYKYKQRYVPRDEYLKQNSTNLLTQEQKTTIYTMFELYERWKQNQSGYDILDLNNYILSELQEKRCNIPSIHFTVIDEVQDLPFSVIQLFTQINEYNIFFSGDSTQNIARGVGFKFNDLKSLFEKIQPSQQGQVQIQVHHLTVNFRSQKKILQLSNSIIDLLYNLFPTTLDVMQKETSEIEGISPIVLVDADQNFLFKILKGQSESLDFGSNQAIIVRDEESKQRLPSILKHAICLTILEAKGLEFEDVILYDFFSDSSCTFQQLNYCRPQVVINDNIKQINKSDQENEINLSINEFNPVNNVILCSELKQLYTAITRPKKRLIIFDNQEYKRKPILQYWLQKNLVCQISPQDFKANNQEKPILEQEQNKEKQKIIKDLQNQMHLNQQVDWYQQGINMFKNKYYQQAIKCFEKIGKEKLIQQAKLHLELQNCSKEIQNTQNELQILKLNHGQYASLNQSSKNNLKFQFCKKLNSLKQSLSNLGDQFYQIDQKNQAAQCYFNSEQYEMAGKIYEELQLYNQAAESYLLSNSQLHKAAEIYEKLNHLEQAIHILELQENWKQIILLLSRNPQYKITDDQKSLYTENCLKQIFQNKFDELKMEKINQLLAQKNLEDSFTLFDFELDDVTLNEVDKDISFLEKQINETELQGSNHSFEDSDIDINIENENTESEQSKQINNLDDISQFTLVQDEKINNIINTQINEERLQEDQYIISLNQSFVSNSSFGKILSEENELFQQINQTVKKQIYQILQVFMLSDNSFIKIVQESLNQDLDQNQFKSKFNLVEFLLQKLDFYCLNNKIMKKFIFKMEQFQFQDQIWIFVVFLKQYQYIPTIIQKQIYEKFQHSSISNLVLSDYLKENNQSLAKKQEYQRQSIFLIQSMLNVVQKILNDQKLDNKILNFTLEYLQQTVLLGFGELFIQFMQRYDMLNLYLLYGKYDQYLACVSSDKSYLQNSIQEGQIKSDEDIQLAIVQTQQCIYQIIDNKFKLKINLKQQKIIQSLSFNQKFQLLIQNYQNKEEQYQSFTQELLQQLEILLKNQEELNEIQIFDVVSAFFLTIKYFYRVEAFDLLLISQLNRIQLILQKLQNDLQYAELVQDRRLTYMTKAMLTVFQVREIPDSQIFQIFGKQNVVMNFSNNLISQIFQEYKKNKKQEPQMYFCDQNFEQVLAPLEVVISAIFQNLDQISKELQLLTEFDQTDQKSKNKIQNKKKQDLDKFIITDENETEDQNLDTSFYVNEQEEEENKKLDQILLLINNFKSKQFDKNQIILDLKTIKLRQDSSFIKLFEGKNSVTEQEISEIICQDKWLLQYGLSRMYNQRQQMKGQTNTEHIIYNIIINNLANQKVKLIIPQKYVGYFYDLEKNQLLIRDINNAINFKQKNPNVVSVNLNEYDNDFDIKLIAQFIDKNKDKSQSFQKIYFVWILMILANVYDLSKQTLNQFIQLIQSIQLDQKTLKILQQNWHYKNLLNATSAEEANDLAYELVTQNYFEEIFGYWEDITVYNDANHEANKLKFDQEKQNLSKKVNQKNQSRKRIINFLIQNRTKIKFINEIELNFKKILNFLEPRVNMDNKELILKKLKQLLITNFSLFQSILKLYQIQIQIISAIYLKKIKSQKEITILTQKLNQIYENKKQISQVVDQSLEYRVRTKLIKYSNYDEFKVASNNLQEFLNDLQSELQFLLDKSVSKQKMKPYINQSQSRLNQFTFEKQKCLHKKSKQQIKYQKEQLRKAIQKDLLF